MERTALEKNTLKQRKSTSFYGAICKLVTRFLAKGVCKDVIKEVCKKRVKEISKEVWKHV